MADIPWGEFGGTLVMLYLYAALFGFILGCILTALRSRIEATVWRWLGRLPGVEVEVISRKELRRWLSGGLPR